MTFSRSKKSWTAFESCPTFSYFFENLPYTTAKNFTRNRAEMT